MCWRKLLCLRILLGERGVYVLGLHVILWDWVSQVRRLSLLGLFAWQLPYLRKLHDLHHCWLFGLY
mgnify:FL=1